jgi:hypothetical protein
MDMTATERLRALLDERGVEWDADDEAMDDGSLSQVTYWYCNGIEWSADGRDEYLAFDAVQLLTPEQAIAATLGRGTCRLTDNGPWGYPYVCSACGASFDADVNGGGFNFCPNCGRKVVDDG